MARGTGEGLAMFLTPDALAACYDFLAETPPFNKWNLPHSDEVMFIVNRSRKYSGDYHWNGERHVIRISSFFNRRVDTLIRTTAHEMIHLFEERAGFARPNVQHSKAFQKLANKFAKPTGSMRRCFETGHS
jgi:hypothetical protein